MVHVDTKGTKSHPLSAEAHRMERSRSESEPVAAQLGLCDAISIIVGIVIGAGIYESPPRIFGNVAGPEIGLACWALAGFVAVLSGMNLMGLVLGKRTQNLLSVAKILGLAGIIVAGFVWGQNAVLSPPSKPPEGGSFGMAMIFVLYTYGGWNDAAFVAAEVRN